LAPISFFSYANYQLAFFTLLAGPIQRYNDFQRSWADMGLTSPDRERETLAAWQRILMGMIKMVGIAPLFWRVFEEQGEAMGSNLEYFSLGAFALYFYSYPVFMYFNFSGYTDIAIGAGRLFGFHVSENFNRPYLARNVIDFWNRWHTTLTFWIRDYVFMTSYKAAAERFPNVAKYFGYGLLFFALFLAGVWHGSSYGFAAFGIINGLGAAVNQIYGDFLRSRLGRTGFQNYLKNRWIELAAIVITFHYFCFSMLFFSSFFLPALRLLLAFFRTLLSVDSWTQFTTVEPAILVLVGMAAAALFAISIKDRLAALGRSLVDRATHSVRAMYKLVLTTTALVVLVFLTQWILALKDPVVVYMQF
jgi:D-alanyl-lipoteichoic acid acyltransferase DltB (MBOAT superfamily)